MGLLSIFAYVALLMGPVHIGSIVFDIHTLFYAQAGLVLGILAMALGIIVRVFGMREGLLQEHAFLDRLRASPVLEIGGLLGVIMVLMGLYWGGYSFTAWSSVGFSSLALGDLLRIVSLSTTLIIIGGITLMSSLIMGFLSLPTREQRF